MPRHCPDPAVIYEAVARAFNTDVDTMNSKSRVKEAMEGRAASIYLLEIRGKMKVGEIMRQTGYTKREALRRIADVVDRLRVDHDFYMRTIMAELIIINQDFHPVGLPALQMGAAGHNDNSPKLF